MRFPGFIFGGASFGRDRRSVRPRCRRGVTHRLGGEALEGRAVLAVVVPAPIITRATDGANVLRTGGVTNSALLTISGTVSSSATSIEVFNGNFSLGTATPAGKTWSFTTAALGEGIYNFRARATNGTATSPASARAFVVTVDTTAPNAPTVSNVLDDRVPFVGTVARNASTNDRTLTLIGTAEPGSRVEVFADLNGSGTPVSLGIATLVGSTWRFTTKPLPSDGVYAFTATATDRARNTSGATVSPYAVTVDTAETTPVISEINDDVPGRIGNLLDLPAQLVTNDRVLELKGTADAGSTVRIFDGNTLLGTVRSNGNWTFTTRQLANGQTYRFAVQSADMAGNTSARSIPTPILIDTTAPWRPLITDVKEVIGDDLIADRGATNETSLMISGRAEPGSTVTLYDGTTVLSPDVVVGPTGIWSLTVSGLTEGIHPFHATAVDEAGNTSVLPSPTYTVTVDLTAPAAPTIDSAVDAVLPNLGIVGSGDSTNDTRPLLTGTTELGAVVTIVGAGPTGTAVVTGTTWTFRPAAPLPDGTYTVTATATDAAGNQSAASASYVIVIDTTAAGFAGFGTEPVDTEYEFGDTVYIDVEFDEGVVVDVTDGTPRIALSTVPQRYATYDSGSGTDTLRFKYEPQLGDKTTGPLDVSPAVIDPNGGTIRDAAGNDVDPSLGSLAGRDIKVDARLTIRPLESPPNAPPLPTLVGPGPTLSAPLPPLTITFNAPLTNGLTVDSFDLFLEDRSMSTAGVLIEDLGGNSYRLTLPAATHQSLRGRYRLDIGGLGSGIESGGVLMDTVVSLYWELA